MKVDRIGRLNKAEDSLQRVSDKNKIGKRCDRLPRRISKSQLFPKRSIRRKPYLRKRHVRRNFLSLKKDIREKILSDNRSCRRSLILEKEEDTRRILKKNIKEGSLLVRENRKTLSTDRSDRQILILIRKDFYESRLKNNIQKKIVEINNQQSVLIAKKYNLNSSLLLKQEKVHEDNHESILLPKRKIKEDTLLTKINLKEQLTQENVEKDLLSEKNNILHLFSKNYISKNPHLSIKKNVNDNPKKNTSIDPLMQLMDKSIQKNLELSSIIDDKVFLVKKYFEKASQLSTCVRKSSSLLQRKDISDDIKLAAQIESNFLLTENNVQENLFSTKNIFAPTKEVSFSSSNQDTSLAEEEKDISEKGLSLTKRTSVQDQEFSSTKKCSSSTEESISLIEKKKRLSQTTKWTICNYLSLNKNLTFKQTSDSVDLPYRSSIIHRRHLLSKVARPILQEPKKVRNSNCKAKRSPPPEEVRLSQGSTGFDNDGSTDKHDSSIAKCRLTDSNCYAKQSIAKSPEVHITISKISSCRKQDSSEESSEVNFIAEFIESASGCTNFEENLKRNLKDSVIRIEDSEKVSKIRATKVKYEETLKKPVDEVKDSEESLKNSIVGIKDCEETLTSRIIEVNGNDLPILKIIDNLEGPTHQRIVQKSSQNFANCTNHRLDNSVDRRLSLIVNSRKNRESISKNPSIKIEKLVTKIYTNNSPVSKNNLESPNNQRLIRESYHLLDQSDDSRLPRVEQRLLGGNERSGSIDRLHKKNSKMKLTIRLIRIRDKLVLGLSAFAIVFTLLLVMDLQMDLGYSGHHLTPSHARVRVGDPADADSVYNNFRRKFLQRGNGSREQPNGDATPVVEKSGKSELTPSSSTVRRHDDFADLMDLVMNGDVVNVDEGMARVSGRNRDIYNPTLGDLKKMIPR